MKGCNVRGMGLVAAAYRLPVVLAVWNGGGLGGFLAALCGAIGVTAASRARAAQSQTAEPLRLTRVAAVGQALGQAGLPICNRLSEYTLQLQRQSQQRLPPLATTLQELRAKIGTQLQQLHALVTVSPEDGANAGPQETAILLQAPQRVLHEIQRQRRRIQFGSS